MPQAISDRFWGKVKKGPGCWLLQAARDENGYGHVFVEGKTHKAHRLAWMLRNGDIPPGAQITQQCGQRACCRPDHLEIKLRAPAKDPLVRAQHARMKAVKGLGSIQRRGKKSFRLRVANGRDPRTGRRRPIEETFTARSDDPATQEEEALEALAALILDKAAGRTRVEVAFTFGEVLDLWFAQTITELEELTADSYRGYLAHVPDWLRELPVDSVTTEHLEDLYRQLRTNGNKRTGKPLAIKYVRGGVHLCINNALQMARRRRWIRRNPAADVEWPNPKKAKRSRRRPTPTPVPGARSILTLARERYATA